MLKPNSATSHARPVALVLGMLLAGCSTPAGPPVTFEQHDVVTGSAQRQTVMSGFFLDGAMADLAVVTIEENDDPRLRIYAFGDGTWAPALDATLRPGVRFVDVVNIGGRDRLVTYRPGHLDWFDPESATESALVAVRSDFNPPPRGVIPHVNVTRDVNGDDRDDLVVPDGHSFRVFIQLGDGTFADPVKIGPSTGMDRVYGADGYRYDPWGSGRVHEMDYNRDGRSDLVFWDDGHFEVHLQDERGRFAPTATTFTTDVAFDSDELDSLVAPRGVRRRRIDEEPAGDLTGRVLDSLTDMNGDGVADLVVYSLEGGSLWCMHSAYEVYFGTPTPDGGTVFAPEVSTAIRSDGIVFGMDQHDFDDDGQVDMMFMLINPDIFKVAGMLLDAALTGYISLDLELHGMEGSVYPDKPNATRKVRADVPGKEGGKSFYPPVLVADVNGDGRPDLLMGRGRKQLLVYAGVPGPDLFDRQPRKLAVAIPEDEEYTWLADLDKDGRADILMHHPSTTEPHRVTMLIAR